MKNSFGKYGYLFTLASIALILLALNEFRNDFVNNSNIFLKEFSGFNGLTFFGLIATIALPMVGVIFLEIQRIEKTLQSEFKFTKTRVALKKNTTTIVICLFTYVFLSILRGDDSEEDRQGIFNCINIFLIFCTVFAIYDIARTLMKLSEA